LNTVVSDVLVSDFSQYLLGSTGLMNKMMGYFVKKLKGVILRAFSFRSVISSQGSALPPGFASLTLDCPLASGLELANMA
jgi:hypothetical protein